MTKKTMVIILIFGFLLILSFAMVFVFKKDNNQVIKDSGVKPDMNRQNMLEEKREKLSDVYAGDRDQDGLTDEQEKELGTSDLEFDTDGDGLPDSAEVNEYKTDPKNVDTDGDGYWDGLEVMNGHNPLGE